MRKFACNYADSRAYASYMRALPWAQANLKVRSVRHSAPMNLMGWNWILTSWSRALKCAEYLISSSSNGGGEGCCWSCALWADARLAPPLRSAARAMAFVYMRTRADIVPAYTQHPGILSSAHFPTMQQPPAILATRITRFSSRRNSLSPGGNMNGN